MRTFSAVVFHADFPGGKSEGLVSLQSHGFLINVSGQDSSKTYELRFDHATAWRGGAGNKLVFFRSRHRADLSFYIQENSGILKACDDHLPPSDFKLEIKGLRRSVLAAKVIGVSIAVSIVLSVALGVSQWGRLMGYVSKKIPFTLEKKVGDRLAGLYLVPGSSIEDKEVKKNLQDLMDHLRPGLGDFFQNYTFHISKNPELNAFALPGGHIVFTTGMLLSAQMPEEILGVAAHEMAHVTQRHITRSMMSAIGLWGSIQLFFGDVGGVAALLLHQGNFLLNHSFSRENESEADKVGFDYLVASNIDPRGLEKFFKRLLDQHDPKGDLKKVEKYTVWLSTHPATESRSKNILDRFEALPKKKFSKINFPLKRFQSRIKKLEKESK